MKAIILRSSGNSSGTGLQEQLQRVLDQGLRPHSHTIVTMSERELLFVGFFEEPSLSKPSKGIGIDSVGPRG